MITKFNQAQITLNCLQMAFYGKLDQTGLNNNISQKLNMTKIKNQIAGASAF